jgi:hypothetical protein
MLECLNDLLVEGVADKTWADVADKTPNNWAAIPWICWNWIAP